MLALPHSAVLAWWLTAWLRGHEQTDDVLDVLAADTQLLAGGSALDLLTITRASGASYAGLALPVDGDPLGLGGPRDFNAAAMDAGSVAASAAGSPPASTSGASGVVGTWRRRTRLRHRLSTIVASQGRRRSSRILGASYSPSAR